jgi:putative tryptophan/tyrosine transport system substrate-binding protein
MRRREVMVLLGGAMTAARALRAQQKPMPVIGFLHAINPIADLLSEFRNGLAEQGYFEGRNVTTEYRFAGGRFD